MAYSPGRPPIVVNPRATHTATIIMLHGLGDTGHGWEMVSHPQVWAKNLPDVKFIFPTAPIRPVTINMGMRGTAWFDARSLSLDDLLEDEAGLNDSLNEIVNLVEKEIKSGISSKRIIIGGFSQGASLALYCLRANIQFGAVLGMSSYLSMRKKLPLVSEENQKTPVLLCHGTQDPLVRYQYGEASFKMLQSELENIEFKSYAIGHTASDEELDDVRVFLESILLS